MQDDDENEMWLDDRERARMRRDRSALELIAKAAGMRGGVDAAAAATAAAAARNADGSVSERSTEAAAAPSSSKPSSSSTSFLETQVETHKSGDATGADESRPHHSRHGGSGGGGGGGDASPTGEPRVSSYHTPRTHTGPGNIDSPTPRSIEDNTRRVPAYESPFERNQRSEALKMQQFLPPKEPFHEELYPYHKTTGPLVYETSYRPNFKFQAFVYNSQVRMRCVLLSLRPFYLHSILHFSSLRVVCAVIPLSSFRFIPSSLFVTETVHAKKPQAVRNLRLELARHAFTQRHLGGLKDVRGLHQKMMDQGDKSDRFSRKVMAGHIPQYVVYMQ